MPKAKTAPPPAFKAAPTPAPAAGIRKINLGGFAQESAKPGGKAYPVLPDPDGTVAEVVKSILDKTEQLDALTTSLDLEKAELRAHAAPFYFTHWHGQHAIASSVDCRDPQGRSALVQLANSYKAVTDEAAVTEIVGADTARYFAQSFEFKIKGDLIPAEAVEELLEELQELFTRHKASAALTAKAVVKPTKDFRTARHTLLSVEQNLELERLCPIIAKVTTKGRAEKEAQ